MEFIDVQYIFTKTDIIKSLEDELVELAKFTHGPAFQHTNLMMFLVKSEGLRHL